MEPKRDITVKPVDQSNWIDFERLFKSKGAPKYCWCMAWRATNEELKLNNPTSRKRFIKKRVSNKVPIGLLAYVKDDPIAWCSIAPRETFQRLGGDESLKNVWSLTCFYVKREYRRKGILEILISNAKKYAKKHRAKYLEAYPVEPDSPSYRFMGFISNFENADFSFVKKAGTRRHVMTCEL